MERGVLVQTGSGRGRRARSSPLTFRRFGRAINTDEVFGTHRDQVLDVFRDANEPLTPKSVTEQLKTRPGVSQSHFSHSAVRKILSRMAENGDLVRLNSVNTPSHRVSVTQSQFQERMIQTVEV